jgi:hypothetical protein
MSIIAISICFLFSALCSGNDIPAVPYGPGILPNGFIGDNEWQSPGTARHEMDQGVILYLSQDTNYIYLGIHSADTQHTGIDLYVKSDKSCRMRLHISSACGQSQRCDSDFSDLEFGENRLWASNVVESIYEDGKTKFLDPDIFEYQIDKAMLPGKSLQMMIHLKRPEKIVPTGADPESLEGWYQFRL